MVHIMCIVDFVSWKREFGRGAECLNSSNPGPYETCNYSVSQK